MKRVAHEGRKVKPIPPTTPSRFTDRKTSRMNLKPAEDFFFFSLFCFSPFPLNPFFISVLLPFFIPFSFHPLIFYTFFLPSFIYFLILIFVKISFSYLSSDRFITLPSFHPFSIPFSPSSLLLLYFFFLLFPQVRQ